MKIGLISDTHGYLDDAVFTYFEHCDEIWHAGDFGTMEVVERLQAFKPLRGVYGNIDGQPIRKLFPEQNRFVCEGFDVLMVHIGGYPGNYDPAIRSIMQQQMPKLLITGLSHVLKVMYDKAHACLHLNPGAARKQGWHKVKTLMRFTIQTAVPQNLEVIELGEK